MSKILIALDGSSSSEKVIPTAAALAERCGYDVTLLSVWEVAEGATEWGDERVTSLSQRGVDYLVTYLNRVRADLKGLGLSARVEARVGHAAVQIIAAAQDLGADMIAMCTHGRRSVPEGRRGSVADKVLRGAAVPVLAVGPLVREAEPGKPVRFQRILVPLDGSVEAEEALPVAANLADGLGAQIQLLRVVTPALGSYGSELSEAYDHGLDDQRMKVAKDYLRATAKRGSVEAVQAHLGFPRDAVKDFVERAQIDLVVMTSHSRYAAGLWTLGGVADALLDGPAPVVLLRPSTA